jgi:hypothetical protein
MVDWGCAVVGFLVGEAVFFGGSKLGDTILVGEAVVFDGAKVAETVFVGVAVAFDGAEVADGFIVGVAVVFDGPEVAGGFIVGVAVVFDGPEVADGFVVGVAVVFDGAGVADGFVVGVAVRFSLGDEVLVGDPVGLLLGDFVGGFARFGMPKRNLCSNLKFTDPRPVVGSQPGAAWKPSRQHGTCWPTPQLFFPKMISFVNSSFFLYRVGFNQPTGDILAAKRAPLIMEIIPAKTGQDADVPETENQAPPIEIR